MDRRSLILEKAQRTGRVMVDDLAQEFGVSTHTIRRDINVLCEQAKLRRLHGGAEFIDGSANLPYSMRAILNANAKTAIAAEVASLIPDEATVFISIGTTPAMVAAELAGKNGLTVITNNLNAAMAVAQNTTHRIILPGGELRLPDRDMINLAAIRLFEGYRADFGIYGVGGIDPDGSLLDFHEEEVQIRQQIHSNAHQSILVADKTKFGRRAAAVGGHLNEADYMVIDDRPDGDFSNLLDDYSGQLIVAREEA